MCAHLILVHAKVCSSHVVHVHHRGRLQLRRGPVVFQRRLEVFAQVGRIAQLLFLGRVCRITRDQQCRTFRNAHRPAGNALLRGSNNTSQTRDQRGGFGLSARAAEAELELCS